jgi:hypothetical protein
MKEIDFFLKKFSSISTSLEMKVSFSSILSLVKIFNFSSVYQSSFSQTSLHDKEIYLALFKMNKALILQIVVIREKLNAYRESKNVDSTFFLLKQYHEFLDVFFKKKFKILSSRRSYDHVINFKKNTQISSQTLYDMSRIEIEKLRRYLNENLVKEFIRISRSHVVLFVMFVKKSKEKLRFYVNYRALNAITIKNRYSLSLIIEILHRLIKIRIFIKIDIIVIFNMLRIREEDEKLTTFCIRFDLFEFLILSFDLCNKLVSFQHFINDTLYKYFNAFCTAYLDDIFIDNNNKLKHETYVKKILFKLREANLQVDIIKCKFHVIEIAYLSMIVIIKRIKMNSVKMKIVIN